VFWVISVYFNIRNTLPKSGTFLLGHSVYSAKENHEENPDDGYGGSASPLYKAEMLSSEPAYSVFF
jgi:hypothetical protein